MAYIKAAIEEFYAPLLDALDVICVGVKSASGGIGNRDSNLLTLIGYFDRQKWAF